MLEDIPKYSSWVKIEPIVKGWSLDKKYYIENDKKKKMLLRISDVSEYSSKHQEYEYIKSLAKLEINMPYPLDFGVCSNNTFMYSLFSWVDG